jgi:hypothetical protein
MPLATGMVVVKATGMALVKLMYPAIFGATEACVAFARVAFACAPLVIGGCGLMDTPNPHHVTERLPIEAAAATLEEAGKKSIRVENWYDHFPSRRSPICWVLYGRCCFHHPLIHPHCAQAA